MSEIIATLSVFGGSYAATLGMAAVCSYLGLFTVLRRIVFTGVALAQLAAAGVAAAFFVADHPAAPPRVASFAARYGTVLGSVGLSLLGALGLQYRPLKGRLSADALVGLVYAASAALAVLFVWRSSRGLVELRNILAGEVLLTSTGELLFLWIGLIAVAMLHAAYRRAFLLVSFDPEFARAMGLPERRYQLFLLASLAVAVALSLRAGGLLLVFAFLVLPPLAGLTLGRRLTEATVLAVCAALGASLVGFVVAIRENLPVASSIAVVLLLLLGAAHVARLHRLLGWLARGIFVGLALIAVVVAVVVVRLPTVEGDDHGHGHTHGPSQAPGGPPTREERFQAAIRDLAGFGDAGARAKAAHFLHELHDSRAIEPLVWALADDDDGVREEVREALWALRDLWRTKPLLRELAVGPEPELRLYAAQALVAIGERDGIERHLDLLGDAGLPQLARADAVSYLRELAGDDFGYDPSATATAAARARWRTWWVEHGEGIVWSDDRRAFIRTGPR